MNDELTTRLRAHDPARGKELDLFDRARVLRAAAAGQGHGRRAVWTRYRVAAAFIVPLVAVVIAAVAVRRERQQAAAPPRAATQIQYVTPGGTRIVWSLDSDFHM